MIQKKAIVFGVHSFTDDSIKVGIQFIAEGLASLGWTVDYISLFSSPFDLIKCANHNRFARVWIKRQDKHGITIRPGLNEYAFRAFFPAHKSLLRKQWQLRTFPWLLPSWFKRKAYDLCINDITGNVIYLPYVQTKRRVLRLNDLPEGFRYALSAQVINSTKNHIQSVVYDEIWAAHKPLTRYALKINKNNHVLTIHNGVDDRFTTFDKDVERVPKSAVYLGSIEQWVDLELLDACAAILPDWQFDIIGPMHRSWPIQSKNIRWLPPVKRKWVPETLRRYTVGLIPFRDIEERLQYVEKPLKFYEYIGGGLGVASTSFGALKEGMGDWASYGNRPHTFATAIQNAATKAGKRSLSMRKNLINRHSWSCIMQTINNRVQKLCDSDSSPLRHDPSI